MKLLTIGALSRAADVPVGTLRTWERRYGFPTPVRLPSGHRRYEPSTVDRLVLVRRALDGGGRASEVVAAPPSALRALVSGRESSTGEHVVDDWVASAERLRARELEPQFALAWDRHGARAFVEEFAVEFLRRLGQRWADGELQIVHEHFATEHLRDFLAPRWRRLSAVASGGTVVCATLPGEAHTIGLHLAATLLSLHGFAVALVGGNTPPAEILRASRGAGAEAVLVGTSVVPPTSFRRDLEQVLDGLGGSIPVLVGGPLPADGFARLGGWVHIHDLPALRRWCEARGGGR